MQWAITIEHFLYYGLSLVILGLAVWALLDALRHGAQRYLEEGKRTKGWWLGLTGASTFVALLSALPSMIGGPLFLQLIAACIACVYLADVRPAVSGKSGNWYY
ncbi:DUF2516 family protein [Glutamicibacter sp. PS]|uniref:DUF2516 family protein n=1 Tax=Glutamicibacter TaxID=1742989 RepID=UPI0028428C6F|nr:DUF2516 family protein [Glutamicibacter sp. PS]MDR4533869.1 DUF2516 family protein [Glutamicibacter sp. PS]